MLADQVAEQAVDRRPDRAFRQRAECSTGLTTRRSRSLRQPGVDHGDTAGGQPALGIRVLPPRKRATSSSGRCVADRPMRHKGFIVFHTSPERQRRDGPVAGAAGLWRDGPAAGAPGLWRDGPVAGCSGLVAGRSRRWRSGLVAGRSRCCALRACGGTVPSLALRACGGIRWMASSRSAEAQKHAAFVGAQGMNFINDAVGNVPQCVAGARSEQQMQRFRRGNENVRRPANASRWRSAGGVSPVRTAASSAGSGRPICRAVSATPSRGTWRLR